MSIASEYLCGKVPFFFILQIFDLRHKGAYAVCDKPAVDEELSLSVSSILALTRVFPTCANAFHDTVTWGKEDAHDLERRGIVLFC